MMKREVVIIQITVGSLTVSYSYFPYNFNIKKNWDTMYLKKKKLSNVKEAKIARERDT